MTGPSATERALAVAAFDPDVLQGLVARDLITARATGESLAVGVPASPGRGAGAAYFELDAALAGLDRGEAVVFVVPSTSPADEPVIRHAAAVVTAGGGTASHAAIVARGWGVPAVCGVDRLSFEAGSARFGAATVRSGDALVVDGSTGVIRRAPEGDAAVGRVAAGEMVGGAVQTPARTPAPTTPQLPGEMTELLTWADEITAGRVAVFANAESPADVAVAMRLGATGVGLCRSEHWFLGEHRPLLAQLLPGGSDSEHPALLDRFEQVNRLATEALLDALDGAPATVRLLDASPAEFGIAGGVRGERGVRAARLRSDLYRAQLRALTGVAADRAARGEPAGLRVLVPMVGGPDDLEFVSGLLDELRPAAGGVALPVGAMIEVPRAALTAAQIARRSAFLTIGTNDLTALAWGVDRNAPPVPGEIDPFASLDVDGVGRLIGLAIADARAVVPDLDVSACGEVAGDPSSIGPLIELGVTTLSVSPHRVAGARLAAAQALLRLDTSGSAPPLGAG